MKKVLIATPLFPPSIGGPATYVKLLSEELPKKGIEVSVVSFDLVRHLPKGIRHMVFFWRVLKEARKTGLVFAQDPVSVGLPSLFAAFISRRPFAAGVHGDYVWEQSRQRFGVVDSIDDFQHKKYGFRVEVLRWVQKKVVRSAIFTITPSNYLRDIVRMWTREPERIVTTYFAADVSSIQKSPALWGNDRRQIFTAGRLVPWKGFSYLLDVLHSMPPLWHLLIVGDGPDRDVLEKKVAALGVADRVRFTGAISHKELVRHMLESDLYILNSSFESFSFQTVEAMKAGLPVVATTIGSFPEIVRHMVDGILVTPNDEEGIVDAVKQYEDGVFRQKMIKSAMSRAEYFSVDKTIDGLVKLIQKTI